MFAVFAFLYLPDKRNFILTRRHSSYSTNESGRIEDVSFVAAESSQQKFLWVPCSGPLQLRVNMSPYNTYTIG